MDAKPTFKEALKFWWKLGWISFGGPAGQIAIMHRHVVEDKKWLAEDRFMHALNYCMLLPGPEAQQLATYLGWLLHGIRGGIVAGLLFILPSVFILGLLSTLYVVSGHIAWVGAMFDGLQPAVLAIIILAFIKIGKKSLKDGGKIAVAIAAWLALAGLHLPFPLIIFSVLLLALGLSYYFLPRAADTKTPVSMMEKKDVRMTVIVVGVALILWALPFLVFLVADNTQFAFWKDLSLFFTKAALVTFGGAYAVLPYVAQTAVEQYHWLSAAQMVDGLALGETTPGPLIMVLTFVGFMAAFQEYGNIWWMGIPGLLVTAFYTFLPSFVFILAGAPWVEKTAQNARWKYVLGFVTAAVVGVLLNLCFFFGKNILLTGALNISNVHWSNLVWTILSLLVLSSEKIGMVTWIVISALYGIAMLLVQQFML